VFDRRIAGKLFEETFSQHACSQIMVKLLTGKTLLLWVNSGDSIVDMKLKLESILSESLLTRNNFCLKGNKSMIGLCYQAIAFVRIQLLLCSNACMEELGR
jgi:hypothetical protein